MVLLPYEFELGMVVLVAVAYLIVNRVKYSGLSF